MDNEQKQEGVETEVADETETTAETSDSKVKLTDEEKLARLEGGAKRLRKKLGLDEVPAKKEEVKSEPKKSDEKLLERLEKLSLRSEGVTHPDDVELARNTAKKWGIEVDEVLADEDFKVKLERQQTARANVAATAGIRGGGGSSDAKNTPEHWVSKGVPPTREQIPDRKLRAKIGRAFLVNAKTGGKTFYND